MKFTNSLLLLLLLLASVAPVSAKRAAPAPVAPVVADGVRYAAPPEAMGFVVATDAGGKELWRVRVYKVEVDPKLEADVQHVFITALDVKGGILTVTNERGEKYALDVKTLKVTRQ